MGWRFKQKEFEIFDLKFEILNHQEQDKCLWFLWLIIPLCLRGSKNE